MNSLNVEQIQEIIPHRHPFLLIDKIEDYVPGEYAIGYKGVSYHEDFFRGHFPQKAVMPGGTCSDRSCGNLKCTGESGKDCILRWCTKMSLQRNGISGRSVEIRDKDY